jgi:hypothetical protein
MRAVLFSVVMLGVGCGTSGGGDDVGDSGGGSGGDPGDDGHGLIAPPLDGSQTQGKYLLGEILDVTGKEPGYLPNVLPDGVTAGGEAVQVQFDGSASLRSGSHRGADPFFNGMLLSGSEGARLRLTVSRGGYDVALYRVETRTGTGWVDVCKGGEAIPLAGKWQKTGFHERAADRFSFACADSVAFKCTLWGYLAGGDDTSLPWRAHQACTRMARGDYCANGVSHTRPGTRIQIYDLVGVSSPPPQRFDGVQSWPPTVGRMFFEAAWNDAAHPASCLSRLRWQSLPVGTLCQASGELRDPRLDTGVRFCDDIEWPAPGTAPTGALLFNESFYDDLSLHVWQSGDDQVSTVRGYYQMPGLIPPFPGAGIYTHVRNDGIIVRKLRDGVELADFEELHLYRNGGDLVVAGVSRPPPEFEDMGFEGYARTANLGGVAFNLYRNDKDYLSTTGTPPDGYVLQWRIGFVMSPESN